MQDRICMVIIFARNAGCYYSATDLQFYTRRNIWRGRFFVNRFFVDFCIDNLHFIWYNKQVSVNR